MTINVSGYELKKSTISDAQGNHTSDPYTVTRTSKGADTVTHTRNGPDTVTHTGNVILDQKLLSGRTIVEVSTLPLPMNLTIRLMSQILLTSMVKEIFAGTTTGNSWTSRTPWKISRTCVDGSIPIYTPIHSGMRKSSTPDSNDSSGTSIPIVTSDTTNVPPCGLSVSLNIGNTRKYATPDLRYSNKLDTSIDGNFTNK